MIEKTTIQKVLQYFFIHPTIEIHLRELSRKLKLSMPTILSTIAELKKEKLVDVTKTRVLTTIKANLDNPRFIHLKRVYNLEQLYKSELVVFLEKLYNRPQAIVCFGSFSRGEDLEKSDVDLAIITLKEKNIDLTNFEKRLHRKISLHHINLSKCSGNFKANLYNGIVLNGVL
jgi:predicted nucleotidyltransferase